MTNKKQANRRDFLKGAGIAGAAVMAVPVSSEAEAQILPRARSVPLAATGNVDRDPPTEVELEPQLTCGSDFMVDLFRSLGIEYFATIPGATFKGLHESVINYGMTTEPKVELITVMHEEISVAMAHGYAKIAGKPMASIMHATVGLQHGAMALYNAWADRAPVYGIVGASLDSAKRTHEIEWLHAVFDGPSLVRDFTKFDDTPPSLGQFAESAVRAYKFAMTPPYGPVILALDESLQEDPLPGGKAPAMPKLPQTSPPQGETGAVRQTAHMLVGAEFPVIVADRVARTPAGLERLTELAELLNAAVVDHGGRMNFPWRHPLNQTTDQAEALEQADVILGLELTDVWGIGNKYRTKGAKVVSISAGDLYMKSNYQDLNRFAEVDLAIAADSEATLPSLIEETRSMIDPKRRQELDARGKRLAGQHASSLQGSRELAAQGWDVSPVSTARMCMELYEQIKEDDWSLVSGTIFQNSWPQKLWHADKHYRFIGDSGAYGIGYLPGAALGAAIANRPHGRLTVAIVGDGDLMFCSSALWTAAHHDIPVLYLVHNNRGYHQEVMWIQTMANRRQRGVDRTHIGTKIDNPAIDFAALARSLGVYAEGPVDDPNELRASLKRALAVVRSGKPALIDVVAQPR